MATSRQPFGSDPRDDLQDFSLVLGGPLFQLMRRAHMAGNGLELVQRRTIVLALVAWVPLVLLSAVGGRAVGGTVAVPFLQDVETHLRFLVALPLLVVAELVVHQRMRFVVRQFRERRLITESHSERFEAAVGSALHLRNSVAAEILLIAFVYIAGVPLIWRQYVALSTATWYATPIAEGSTLTLAGWWYICVSLPLFQFLLLRWYFRIFIWVRFLWRASRIELSLVPTHPDRVGGLGFLTNTAHAFIPLAAAHGAVVSGWIANRIFHLGAGLLDFKVEIAVLVASMLCIAIGPLLVFSAQLAKAKRTGMREYGTLAERYAREFDTKWLRGGAPADEPLLGSSDIQSLADFGNSFEVIRGMRPAPIGRDAVLQLAVAAVLPILPLALTMMSLEELLRRLTDVVF